MIVIASPKKPFSVTSKGTLRRQAIINDYAEEIDAAYEAVEEDAQISTSGPVNWDIGNAKLFVRQLIEKTLRKGQIHVDDDNDLFEVGLDRYVWRNHRNH